MVKFYLRPPHHYFFCRECNNMLATPYRNTEKCDLLTYRDGHRVVCGNTNLEYRGCEADHVRDS